MIYTRTFLFTASKLRYLIFLCLNAIYAQLEHWWLATPDHKWLSKNLLLSTRQYLFRIIKLSVCVCVSIYSNFCFGFCDYVRDEEKKKVNRKSISTDPNCTCLNRNDENTKTKSILKTNNFSEKHLKFLNWTNPLFH